MDSITDFLSKLLSPTAGGGVDIFSFFLALAVSYLGGILSSLTPCIYPMIPITISVMGGLGQDKNLRWGVFWARGLSYVGGMAVIYAFLGVIAAMTGKVFGSFTQTGMGYLILGGVITLAALFMLDIILFDPVMLTNKVLQKLKALGQSRMKKNSDQDDPRKGELPIHQPKEMNFFATFTLGASSGFIAAPCTTPVLTAILAYISNTQSVLFGFTLMLAFSLGLGTLLLIITLFTNVIKVLPRSGNWMKVVKTMSGVIMLIFAEYLIFRAGRLGGF